MALQSGHRFAVSMADVFPHGLYAMGVEQAMDYDEKTGRRTPTSDKQTGDLVWTVTCLDRDPEVRGTREVKIKVLMPGNGRRHSLTGRLPRAGSRQRFGCTSSRNPSAGCNSRR